jgi:alpha-methylacyl-CoA racemase
MAYELGRKRGPLRGLRVIEIAGIGPSPHACMTLADLGADVLRIERPGGTPFGHGRTDVLTRGRPSVVLDLRTSLGVEAVLGLVAEADVITEGMRPGAMEQLGLGPERCLEVNPRLVYGRMTGWGQDGPRSSTAGHDLTYTALTGALATFGQDPDRPHFPSNIVGDFAGGSTYMVIGILSALWEAQRSGVGQIVDAAIVDGTAHLSAMTSGLLAHGSWVETRASNLLDGGDPCYDIYRTSDGHHLAVAPLEPQFYAEFLRLLGIAEIAPDRDDPTRREELRELIGSRIASLTRTGWDSIFKQTDGCAAPVLTLSEAAREPHMAAREVFIENEGVLQPAPAPRFSRTAPVLDMPPAPAPGADTRDALTAWGVANVQQLIAAGVAVQA